MKRIGVIGAGQMGNGIAQVAAQAGFEVVMSDIAQGALDRGLATITKSLDKLVSKAKLTEEERAQTLGRIKTTLSLEEACREADMVIEAATEREALKFELFKQMDAAAPAHAILASNTSSISITRIAAQTQRPQQVIGMHFMNPVPLMALVEIIRGLATDDATYEATRAAAEKMGKTCVLAQDYAGFIVNRILMPMINEAVYALMEGVGSVEDIDAAMKLGTNQPMGPLTLADFIGLDTCLAIMQVLHDGTGDTKYRPCPLLRKYVDAGWLGRKSGRGFYNYNQG
jgi:3-hydroxybutyryl-CoA dehydrogenase